MQPADGASSPGCDASAPLLREPISAVTAACDLTSEAGVALSAVSQHLAELTTAGLIAGELRNGWSYHAVQARALRELAVDLNTSANGV